MRKDHPHLPPELGPVQVEARFRDTDKDADVLLSGLPQAVPRIAGIFQRLPGALQEQALLRIYRQRLTRRNIEEQRVEIGETVEAAAPFAVAAARSHRLLRIGFEEVGGRPAVLGNLPNAVPAGCPIFPERVERLRDRNSTRLN